MSTINLQKTTSKTNTNMYDDINRQNTNTINLIFLLSKDSDRKH